QSGGVPTGAIIERGTNANGDYTKFADGTMICTRAYFGPLSLAPASVNTTVLPFSGTFITAPLVLTGVSSSYPYDITGGVETSVGVNSCSVSIKNRNATITVSNIYIQLCAIGRWF
ncbi:MAG: pyocin knob domain-containing protein, partial [Pseudomonas fluorescens]